MLDDARKFAETGKEAIFAQKLREKKKKTLKNKSLTLVVREAVVLE